MPYAHTTLNNAGSISVSAPTAASQPVVKTRDVRLRLAFAVLVTGVYVSFLTYMLMLSTGLPSLGLAAAQGDAGTWRVTSVVPSGISYDSGIRPGDRIVSALDSAGHPLDLSHLPPTGSGLLNAHTIIVSPASAAAGGQVIVANIGSEEHVNSFERSIFALIALVFIGVGGPVYVKARQREAATTFYLFCIATAVPLAVAPANVVLRSPLLFAIMFISLAAWASSFALFFMKFPVRVGGNCTRHNVLVGSVLSVGIAVVLGYGWVLAGHIGDYEALKLLAFLYISGCITVGLAILLRSFVVGRSHEVRQQLVLLLGGTALATCPVLLLSFLPSILFGQEFISVYVSVLALIIMPVAFAYAITQHQLLGVRSLVRRSVIYVVTGFTVLLIFSVMAAASSALIPTDWWRNDLGTLGVGIFVFLIALSYSWLQRRVEQLVDRHIYHDAYDYKEALLQFSAQLAAEQSLPVLTSELVEHTCRLMNLSCGVLLLAEQPGAGSATQGRQDISVPELRSPLDSIVPSSLRFGEAELEYQHAMQASLSHSIFAATVLEGSPASNKPKLNNSGLRLELYAQYGTPADTLLNGLQGELSTLGVDLRRPDNAAQVINFTDTQATAHLEREPTDKVALAATEGTFSGEVTDFEGIHSFLGVPLWTRSYFIGVLCLGGKKTGERFSRDDISLLSTLGSQAALAIYNAQLYEAREQALLDTITALAHAIEAKDTYTINHCEKITDRAVAVAQAMSLPRQEVENIRLGSILHDVGKIGIPDAVLNKPSKLTDDEYEIIKQHAQIGARIVQSVGALRGVVPIVRHHQERYDGRGYPEGLAGEEIPIGARIIAAVDAYGAMTEDRVYRKALGHQKAIEELTRYAGTQFDPQVVAGFIRILKEQPELAEWPNSSCTIPLAVR